MVSTARSPDSVCQRPGRVGSGVHFNVVARRGRNDIQSAEGWRNVEPLFAMSSGSPASGDKPGAVPSRSLRNREYRRANRRTVALWAASTVDPQMNSSSKWPQFRTVRRPVAPMSIRFWVGGRADVLFESVFDTCAPLVYRLVDSRLWRRGGVRSDAALERGSGDRRRRCGADDGSSAGSCREGENPPNPRGLAHMQPVKMRSC